MLYGLRAGCLMPHLVSEFNNLVNAANADYLATMSLHASITTRNILFLAAAVFIIACWFSIGFRHGDEHFQIYEFAGHLLGWNQDGDMAWEYHNRMRPSLQPCITAAGIVAMNTIGISDPFTQAFMFRLVAAALLFYALYRWLKAEGKERDLLAVFCLFFFCLTPYIAARYSSEGLAASMLILLIARLRTAGIPRDYFVAGLLAGLSFAFRFQLAFALAGVAVWYLLAKKFNWKEVLGLAGGFLLVFAFSVLVDRFFYGEWVIAPYQYFYQNIVLDKASNYGVDPWWYYLWILPNYGFWLPGLLVIAAGVYYTIRKPKDLVTWVLWLFVIGHMLVAHKESRFMFPVAILIPYIVYETLPAIRNQALRKWTLGVLIAANVLLLIPSVIFPASQEISLLRFLEKEYPAKDFTLYYEGQNNPYEDFGLRNNYYGRKFPVFVDQATFSDSTLAEPAVWVSFRCNEEGKQVGEYTLKRIYQTYPEWVTDRFNINNWTSRTSILTVYELVKK